jgi:heat shock protein HtpX
VDADRDPSAAWDNWIEAPAVLIFAAAPAVLSLPRALSARIVSRQRELAADRAAAILTGSPAAVASAQDIARHLVGGVPSSEDVPLP